MSATRTAAPWDPDRYRAHLASVLARNDVDVDTVNLPASRQVVVGRMRIHFLDWGQAGRPPALFLHGGGLSAHTWDTVCVVLRRHLHCIAIDLRGHGESEWSPSLDYSLDSHGADVLGVLDELGIERCPLVGMSLGGLVSLSLAEKQPDRVSRLVLVDVGPEPDRAGVDRIQTFMRSVVAFESVDHAIEHALAFNPRRDPTFLRWTLERNLMRLPDGRYAWKYDGRARDTGAYIESTLASARDLVDRTGEVRCPTLLAYGERSRVVSARAAESFVARMPNARAVGIRDAGHSVQGDNPKALIQHLVEFLSPEWTAA